MRMITLRDLWDFFKMVWWIPLLSGLLFGGGAYYFSTNYVTPVYSNTSKLLVTSEQASVDQTFDYQALLLYQKLMGTYKDVIRSRFILTEVSSRLSKEFTPRKLSGMITVTTSANSNVIKLSVQHSDYDKATEIANLLAETFVAKVRELQLGHVRVLDKAVWETPPPKVKPNVKLNIAISVILGMLLSSTGLILWRMTDTRIRDEDELETALEFPHLGSVPRF